PYAQKLIADEAGGSGLHHWLGPAVDWGPTLAGVPGQLQKVLRRLERGEGQVAMPQAGRQLGTQDRSARRRQAGLVFAALLHRGTQFYLAGHMLGGIVLLAGAGVALLAVLFFIRR